MNNLKEFFKTVIDIQNIASFRAKQLLSAKGNGYRCYVTGFEFEDDRITVSLEEDTYHPNPENDSISLTIELIEMNDLDWSKFIRDVAEETANNILKRNAELENIKLEQKQKEYKRLKKELGHE